MLIRSAVATFYARKDTATPVKAALTGVAVNVALKILLVGSLAQIGLALATAVGAWINLLLVIGFAVRAGFLAVDRVLLQSFAKFPWPAHSWRGAVVALGRRHMYANRVPRQGPRWASGCGGRCCLYRLHSRAVRRRWLVSLVR